MQFVSFKKDDSTIAFLFYREFTLSVKLGNEVLILGELQLVMDGIKNGMIKNNAQIMSTVYKLARGAWL